MHDLILYKYAKEVLEKHCDVLWKNMRPREKEMRGVIDDFKVAILSGIDGHIFSKDVEEGIKQMWPAAKRRPKNFDKFLAFVFEPIKKAKKCEAKNELLACFVRYMNQRKKNSDYVKKQIRLINRKTLFNITYEDGHWQNDGFAPIYLLTTQKYLSKNPQLPKQLVLDDMKTVDGKWKVTKTKNKTMVHSFVENDYVTLKVNLNYDKTDLTQMFHDLIVKLQEKAGKKIIRPPQEETGTNKGRKKKRGKRKDADFTPKKEYILLRLVHYVVEKGLRVDKALVKIKAEINLIEQTEKDENFFLLKPGDIQPGFIDKLRAKQEVFSGYIFNMLPDDVKAKINDKSLKGNEVFFIELINNLIIKNENFYNPQFIPDDWLSDDDLKMIKEVATKKNYAELNRHILSSCYEEEIAEVPVEKQSEDASNIRSSYWDKLKLRLKEKGLVDKAINQSNDAKEVRKIGAEKLYDFILTEGW